MITKLEGREITGSIANERPFTVEGASNETIDSSAKLITFECGTKQLTLSKERDPVMNEIEELTG